jgi:cathepsin F
MKAILVCVLLVGIALASAFDAKHEFLQFQRKYNKTYATHEIAYRFQVFQDNMKRAAEHQKKNPLAKFGVTKFSDLSPQEFSQYYLMPNMNFTRDYVAPPVKTDFSQVNTRFGGPNPTQYDWFTQGVCTPIYNQGQCGSCWAFSATETIESYWALEGNQLTQLSIEQIVDCDTAGQDQGCNGGFPSGAYSYVQGAGGIDSYASYPYTAEGGQSGSCQYNQANDVCTVSSQQSLSGEDGLYQQLSTAGPVSVCVDASSWSSYQGGILSSCTNNVDHCVQATGYGAYGQAFPNSYWIVRNSWGADWGENGFIWVATGQDLCSIGDYCTVVADASA